MIDELLFAIGIKIDLAVGRRKNLGVGLRKSRWSTGDRTADAVGLNNGSHRISCEKIVGGWGDERGALDGDRWTVWNGSQSGSTSGCLITDIEGELTLILDDGCASRPAAVVDSNRNHCRGRGINERFRVPNQAGDISNHVAAAA